jgi:hypothetical protein
MSTRTIVRPLSQKGGSSRTGALAPAPTAAVPTQPAKAPLAELWHPWASRHWPCTGTEEQRFVADLESLAGGPVSADVMHDRRDVTALVTALRSGLTVAELLANARGLKPLRLLAAHRTLETARLAGERAWCSIVEAPTSAALRRFGPIAATLLPVIISHLDAIDHQSNRDLESSIRSVDAEIARTAQSVLLLEERLDQCPAPSDRGREIGALLYDGRGEGAWSLGTFLPPRVGTLVPLRVASLLGEDLPGQLRQAG